MDDLPEPLRSEIYYRLSLGATANQMQQYLSANSYPMTGGSKQTGTLRDVFQKHPNLSMREFYYKIREEKTITSPQQRRKLWERVKTFYQRLPKGYGRKSDQAGKKFFETMSQAKKDYLTDLFYKRMKASVGMQALYEIMLADPNKPADKPSWNEVRSWHSAQRVNQLSRPAKAKSKSLATVVNPSMLIPCRRFGCDSIVMQASSADEKKMMDQGYRGMINYVDFTTKRSFPFLVRRIGSAAEAGRKFAELTEQVRREYYNDPNSNRWPSEQCLLIHDAGAEFSEEWKDAVRDALGNNVDTSFQAAQSNNPNSANAITENSNKQIRNVLRRIAQANRTTNQNDGKKKDWRSYWVGPQQIYYKQMVRLVNERPDKSLGRLTPMQVWNAYKEQDQPLIDQSQQSLISNAAKRRGPSRLKPNAYFRPGQIVRRVNTFYTKDGIRSNLTKQGNRYSLSTYKIHKRFGFPSAPPQYELTLHSGTRPADFKIKANGVSAIKYPHDQLILINADEDAPQNLMDNSAPSGSGDFQVGDRVAVEWVRLQEPDEDSPGDFVEFSSVNYANLPALVADGTYSALVPDSEQWFEGEVVKKRTGVYGYIDVLFDDQDADEDDAVRISVNATNRHYVEPDKYVKV